MFLFWFYISPVQNVEVLFFYHEAVKAYKRVRSIKKQTNKQKTAAKNVLPKTGLRISLKEEN